MFTDNDTRYMRMALAEARAAAAAGEVPVGAVVVCRDKVIASAHNLTEALTDVTAHAEMLSVTAAANALGGKFLDSCTLYVTVEPCLMCAGAIAWSRMGRIVIGCDDPKRGYRVQTVAEPFHPRSTVERGLLADECSALMQQFFKSRR